MAHRVHQVNKKTGVTYVYEAVSVWDKEKQQSRSKRVCIGKLDPKTGEFVPSKRLSLDQAAVRDPAVTATTKIVGPSLLLDGVATKTGLTKVVKKCFPSDFKKIMTMAYFLVYNGGPLAHCEGWSKLHEHPYQDPLTSQRISEALKNMTDDGRQTFFKTWSTKVLERDYLCYDITSVSSYSGLNEYVKHGYNRDNEDLKQINLAVLFGQRSQLPVYYNRLPGSVNDVSTLRKVLKTFSYLDLPKVHLVMDKGFFSQKNIDDLLDAREKFTISVPMRVKWLQGAIDEARGDIQSPEGYRKVNDEVLYVHTQLYPWGDNRRRCYLHLYYNAHAAADAIETFMEQLLLYKEEIESGNTIASHQEAYDRYFVVKETPVRGLRVQFNDEAVQKYKNQYAGYFAILTNDIKDPAEALTVYRRKDIVEKCFDDLKNQLDMKRLRVHGSATMDGRLLVQFIALILISALRKEIQDNETLQKYTPRELLTEMATLSKIRYSGKYRHIFTEVTKAQRQILDAFAIAIPT